MSSVKVNIMLEEGVSVPEYATSGSAAFDIRANIEETIYVYPENPLIIPTGIRVEFSDTAALMILPRSGKTLENLSVANSPGLVDSDYRGGIGVIVLNTGERVIEIHPGDRIAQGLFVPVLRADFTEVEELNETRRGIGGFGSTGT